MSSKENPPHLNQQFHTFPIPTYTTEIPDVELPITEIFAKNLDPKASQVLSYVIEDDFFRKNMKKLHKKIWQPGFETEKLEFLQNTITGFSFEIAAHFEAQRIMKQENFILASPEETNFFYNRTTLATGRVPTSEGELIKVNRPVRIVPKNPEEILPIHSAKKKPLWTQSDTIIFLPDKAEAVTYVIGGGEFTTRINIGNASAPMRYDNRDKITQYRYHRSGKAIDDFFVNQPDIVKQNLGEYAQSLYGIPSQLRFEPKWYQSVFAVPCDDPSPVYPKQGSLIRVPITSNTINTFADLILMEMTTTPPSQEMEISAAD